MGTCSLMNSMPEAAVDDQHLLREMRGGNEEAFRLIYERHQGALFRFVLHMTGSPATAEDVTQDVFMHLIRKPRSYDPNKGPLAAYLFGIARNLGRRAFQNSASDIHIDDAEELDTTRAADADVVEKLSNSEALEFLRKAVLGLPELYREVIVLCDLQEMSYAEAAGILECSTGTIASRMNRARSMLRTKLTRAAARGCAL
jgi:RNA polymerase sigma-70 factor, ECF subfamily